MDGQVDAAAEIAVLSQRRSRNPLAPRRSPPATPPKQVRRKDSFIRRLDSSEESPSPHGSIFEALYQSATNSDDTGHVELGTTKAQPSPGQSTSPSEGRENDENIRQSASPASNPRGSDSQFLYGHGTILETIKERTSHGSIRVLTRRKSVDDLRSPSSNEPGSPSSRKSTLRQKSHSLDDLDAVKGSYHENSLGESTAKESQEIHEIYAGPRTPIKDPPQRPDTPLGMPSWTEHQLRSSPRPKLRGSASFRQFFGLQSSRSNLQSGEQCRSNGGTSERRSARARVPRIARFRPPKSAYGTIDKHPFNNAPTAVVDPFLQLPVSARSNRKRKSVRFTPSTAAQGSDPASPPCGTSQGGLQAQGGDEVSSIASPHSTRAGPARRRECPHRRHRFTQPEHSNSTLPGIDYQAILAHPLTRDASHASLPRLPPPSPTHLSPGGWSGRAGSSTWDLGIVETETIGSGAASNSSTTHLMSGALVAPSPSPTPTLGSSSLRGSEREAGTTAPRCWRCRAGSLWERARARGGDARRRSARWLWFVCCGFDSGDDGASEYAPRSVRVELAGARERWWGGMESGGGGGGGGGDGSPLGPVRRAAEVLAYPQAWIL